MRFAWAMVIVLCFLFAAAVCPAAEDPTSMDEDSYLESFEQYQTFGVTIVLGDGLMPLSFTQADGSPDGLAVDIWKAWSRKTGIPVRFIFRDWAQTLEAVRNGTAQIHGGLNYSDKRAEYLDFSESYFETATVLAMHERDGLDCANVLASGLIGVLDEGYSQNYLLSRIPDARFKAYPGYQQEVKDFFNGGTDAILVDYATLHLGAPEGGMSNISICRTVYYQGLHAGVKKGDDVMLRLISDGLSKISPEEFNRLEKQWSVIDNRTLPWMWAVVPACVALLFLIATVVLWYIRRS